MKQLQTLDRITLNAWLDQSNQDRCDYWKDFLSVLLPVLLKSEPEEIQDLIDEAVVNSVEEAVSKIGGVSKHDTMREVSIFLSQHLGDGPEFGLASFVDTRLPTKFYKIWKSNKPTSQRMLNNLWLNRLKRVQSDEEFIAKLEAFKKMIASDQDILSVA